MSICAWWPLSLNVGDRLTPYLIEKIKNEKPIYVEPTFGSGYFIIGGSVLNHAGPEAIVWGSGLGTITDGVNPKTKIKAVRGPISRARALSCGAECPAVYGDPAILVSKFFMPERLKHRKPLGVVPHYVDMFRASQWWAADSIVSPLQDVESFMTALTGYEAIISSSLHGIIFAHMLRIPALWVKLSDSVGGDGSKMRDYYASIGMGDFKETSIPCDMRNGKMEVSPISFSCPSVDKMEMLAESLWSANPL